MTKQKYSSDNINETIILKLQHHEKQQFLDRICGSVENLIKERTNLNML